MLLLLQLESMQLVKAFLCSQRELQRKQEIKQNTRQLCYAQPIQARLIPECKDSLLALLHFTSLTQGCPTRGTRANVANVATAQMTEWYRAFVSWAVDSGLIMSRVKPMTLKLLFTASLLDAQH